MKKIKNLKYVNDVELEYFKYKFSKSQHRKC